MKKEKNSLLADEFELEDRIVRKAATVSFYGNFVVVEFNEGINVSYATAFSLLVKALSVLGRKPWIYISHRKYSYSVKPTDYKYINKIATLKGLIIVRKEEMRNNMEALEANFCQKPFFVVKNMSEAIEIGKKLLEK